MEARQLEYVVAVVDYGGFTAGSEAVGVSQPALSEGIRRLETELGVELFHRVGRRVVLSSAGQALVVQARLVLRDLQAAADSVAAVAGLLRGRLDLVALPTLAVSPLAGIIGAIRRRYPGIRFRVVESEDADGPARLVRNGTAEIGLTELPAPADLESRVVRTQQLYAVFPPGTSVAARITLAELGRWPLIVTPRGTSTRRLIEQALDASGSPVNAAVEVGQREALLPLVMAGAGVAVLPDRLADTARRAGATVCELMPALTRRIGLVHRRAALSPAATVFLAEARLFMADADSAMIEATTTTASDSTDTMPSGSNQLPTSSPR